MDTGNTKPWNEYQGMSEGDMLEELIEKDVAQFNVSPELARESFLPFAGGAIREIYHREIGRHNK